MRHSEINSTVKNLVEKDSMDIDDIRELLVWACHSNELAKNYFISKSTDAEVLQVLLKIVLEDYSDDARMTAAYYTKQFPETLLPY